MFLSKKAIKVERKGLDQGLIEETTTEVKIESELPDESQDQRIRTHPGQVGENECPTFHPRDQSS